MFDPSLNTRFWMFLPFYSKEKDGSPHQILLVLPSVPLADREILDGDHGGSATPVVALPGWAGEREHPEEQFFKTGNPSLCLKHDVTRQYVVMSAQLNTCSWLFLQKAQTCELLVETTLTTFAIVVAVISFVDVIAVGYQVKRQRHSVKVMPSTDVSLITPSQPSPPLLSRGYGFCTSVKCNSFTNCFVLLSNGGLTIMSFGRVNDLSRWF